MGTDKAKTSAQNPSSDPKKNIRSPSLLFKSLRNPMPMCLGWSGKGTGDGDREQNDTQGATFVPWSVLRMTYSFLTESLLRPEAVIRPILQQEKVRHRTDGTSGPRYYFSYRTQAYPSTPHLKY